MITNTGKVLHTTTTHKHDGVLLEVVALTADVGDNFFAIGKANFSNFTKSGVRLLRRTRHHLEADATTLRAAMKSARLRLLFRYDSPFTDELINGRHVSYLFIVFQGLTESGVFLITWRQPTYLLREQTR